MKISFKFSYLFLQILPAALTFLSPQTYADGVNICRKKSLFILGCSLLNKKPFPRSQHWLNNIVVLLKVNLHNYIYSYVFIKDYMCDYMDYVNKTSPLMIERERRENNFSSKYIIWRRYIIKFDSACEQRRHFKLWSKEHFLSNEYLT